jgi:hypothetical protein
MVGMRAQLRETRNAAAGGGVAAHLLLAGLAFLSLTPKVTGQGQRHSMSCQNVHWRSRTGQALTLADGLHGAWITCRLALCAQLGPQSTSWAEIVGVPGMTTTRLKKTIQPAPDGAQKVNVQQLQKSVCTCACRKQQTMTSTAWLP